MDFPFPLPFMIESGGKRYALVERHNLELKNTETNSVVWQSMAWIIEALRFDARTDCRLPVEDQEFASFLCSGDEYMRIKLREFDVWLEDHPGGTEAEFEAQFDCDAFDDSVRRTDLPEWIFLIFDEGAPWPTENILQAPGFRGVFYVWNTRTVTYPEPPEGVWLVSPNPMLAAPYADNEWWLGMFADSMHAMLSYSFPLSDHRELWLEAWQFPTKRTWLAWRSGVHSGWVANLKQRLIASGLELPDPVFVAEERFRQPRPDLLGGGWMLATRRLRQWPPLSW